MGRHGERDSTEHRDQPEHRDESESDDSGSAQEQAALGLQRSAGNRAVAGALRSASTGALGPMGVMAAGLAVALAGAAGARRPPTAPGSAGGDSTAELQLAERWLGYIANRGNDVRPGQPPPPEYRVALVSIQSAVDGPGPARDDELVVDRQAFGEARGHLARLRQVHQRVFDDRETGVYDLAALAIDRGQANFTGAPDGVPEGLTEHGHLWAILTLGDAAESEIRRAHEAGLDVSAELRSLPVEARERFERMQAELSGRHPDPDQLVRPGAEADLVEFRLRGLAIVGTARAARARHFAAIREAEASNLRRQISARVERLRQEAAHRRRQAFMAGDHDELKKVRRSLGALTGAAAKVEETAAMLDGYASRARTAARIAGTIARLDVAIPEIPSLAAVAGHVTGPLTELHGYLDTVGVMMDFARPAKTELDNGLNALRAMGETTKLAGRVPLVDTYLDNYLGPALDRCLESIGVIAGQLHDTNMSLIEGGETRFVAAVHWAVEGGGREMYRFVTEVYRHGDRADLPDETWTKVLEYVDDHRGDLAAAVGERPPTARRALAAWAARNRQALWETLYGSTQPPR